MVGLVVFVYIPVFFLVTLLFIILSFILSYFLLRVPLPPPSLLSTHL